MYGKKRGLPRVRESRYRWVVCVLVMVTMYATWQLIPSHSHVQSHKDTRPAYIVSNMLRVIGLRGKLSSQRDVPVTLSQNNTRDRSKKNTHYLTIKLQARLGNLMFAYASLLGIAQKNDMIPCIADDPGPLAGAFKLTVVTCPGSPDEEWPKFQDSRSATYKKQSEMLNYTMNIQLLGYFQSWKYFDHVKDRIRNEFKFNNWVTKTSAMFLDQIKSEYFPKNPEIGDHEVLFIGVHVRIGDMTSDINRQRGYIIADKSYLEKAMRHFRLKYYQSRLIFVVCSDDMPWARRVITWEIAPVVYSRFEDEILDLSLLSQCDHVIMTVGTYGWWGAWLSGGNVTYASRYATPRSALDLLLEPKDYFYTSWIAL